MCLGLLLERRQTKPKNHNHTSSNFKKVIDEELKRKRRTAKKRRNEFFSFSLNFVLCLLGLQKDLFSSFLSIRFDLLEDTKTRGRARGKMKEKRDRENKYMEAYYILLLYLF